MGEITGGTLLKDILENYPELLPVLARQGFHITFCIAEAWLTLEQIAQNRGIPLEPLLDELNRNIDKSS
ncbi:MAG TPA: DUF1858 domain-containing protein [candidate division Zixibacteria bacterium]|nr:DUF1858 domain-containing protein [candidate division Zixibacteria bacterium]